MTRGILYYTNNKLNMALAKTCRRVLEKSGLPITSVSTKPLKFGKNVVYGDYGEKGGEKIARKILHGLENMTEDIVYFAEADVLYHPDHFKFIPKDKETWYYNGNYWFLRGSDGFAIHYNASPLSGLVVHRESAIRHFKERIKYIEEHGFSLQIGYEPFTHKRIKWEYWCPFEIFVPENPNVDITHGENTSFKRWRIDQFRKKPTFWEESNVLNIPGWPDLPELLNFTPPDETLTIVIPARNEEFIGKTVENILENIEGNTEIIVGLDGYDKPIPPIPQDKRVIILGYHESVGQRAITNQAVRLSKSKYIMKVDAHCAFDKGFDVKMMKGFRGKSDCTMVPIMYNLHAFDWVCKNGHRRYQGPSGPCTECGEPTVKDMLWKAKPSPESTTYCFDSEPHFQYFNEWKKTDTYKEQKKTGFTETMSLQGSCFMLTRDKYWELNICDENFGSWGSQGIEVAVKTWLSGGRVLCNHNTWYAHMFRTQGGDFGFPYSISGRQVQEAKKTAKELFIKGTWEGAQYPLAWLLGKFWPVKGWTEEEFKSIM